MSLPLRRRNRVWPGFQKFPCHAQPLPLPEVSAAVWPLFLSLFFLISLLGWQLFVELHRFQAVWPLRSSPAFLHGSSTMDGSLSQSWVLLHFELDIMWFSVYLVYLAPWDGNYACKAHPSFSSSSFFATAVRPGHSSCLHAICQGPGAVFRLAYWQRCWVQSHSRFLGHLCACGRQTPGAKVTRQCQMFSQPGVATFPACRPVIVPVVWIIRLHNFSHSGGRVVASFDLICCFQLLIKLSIFSDVWAFQIPLLWGARVSLLSLICQR